MTDEFEGMAAEEIMDQARERYRPIKEAKERAIKEHLGNKPKEGSSLKEQALYALSSGGIEVAISKSRG